MSLNVPNLFSLFRLGVIPFFVIALLEGQAGRALVLFLVAGVTDFLDGFLARLFDQVSVLGAYIDPLADKLLLVAAYILLALPRTAMTEATWTPVPVWIVVLVLARDLIIVAVALIFSMFLGMRRFVPAPLSKVNTGFQIAGVVAVLLGGMTSAVRPLVPVVLGLVALTTVISGVDYIVRAARMVEEGGHSEAT